MQVAPSSVTFESGPNRPGGREAGRGRPARYRTRLETGTLPDITSLSGHYAWRSGVATGKT